MRTRRVYRLSLLATAVITVALGLAGYAWDVLERADLSSVDDRFSIRGDQGAPDDIVFVKIDDETFNELRSQFPLPRITHANVIDNLAADGAKTIAYDVQFTEPGPDPAQDNALIESVRAAGNVVLATTEVDENGRTRIFGGGEGLAFSRGIPAEASYPNDPGGVIRRLDFEISGLISFPMAAAEHALGEPMDEPGGDTAWVDYPGGPGTIESISFSDVESGDFEPGMFTDKVVVVGASAPSLQDLHATSTTGDDPMPGPEIHASAIDTILEGFPLSEGPGWLNVLAIVLLGSAAPLLALRISAIRAVLVTVGLVALFALAAQLLFNGGTIVTVVYPVLAAAVAAVVTMLLYGLMTAFERERARDSFARFVPAPVVDQVLSQAGGVRLGGVRTEGTLLFSDLRGFTSFAEQREPAEVIDILNRYLGTMSDAIMDNGGTLVSFMGDGIMAVFGAPVVQEDHADRALAAAKDMLTEMESFNEWLTEEWDVEGFKMGVGLNTGFVMAGNVGSERRLEYTAIGDTTNTAARLEGMTKGTPCQLYFAESTRAALTREPPEEPEQVGDFEVRGRKKKIRVWTLPSTKHEAPKPRRAKAKAKAKAKG
jgi:adenylate cyclase